MQHGIFFAPALFSLVFYNGRKMHQDVIKYITNHPDDIPLLVRWNCSVLQCISPRPEPLVPSGAFSCWACRWGSGQFQFKAILLIAAGRSLPRINSAKEQKPRDCGNTICSCYVIKTLLYGALKLNDEFYELYANVCVLHFF